MKRIRALYLKFAKILLKRLNTLSRKEDMRQRLFKRISNLLKAFNSLTKSLMKRPCSWVIIILQESWRIIWKHSQPLKFISHSIRSLNTLESSGIRTLTICAMRIKMKFWLMMMITKISSEYPSLINFYLLIIINHIVCNRDSSLKILPLSKKTHGLFLSPSTKSSLSKVFLTILSMVKNSLRTIGCIIMMRFKERLSTVFCVALTPSLQRAS